MSRRILSRRHFLRSAAAVLAAPTIVPSLVIGRPAPSNRIALAAIGVGNRGGSNVWQDFVDTQEDVRIVAACDCFKERREAFAAKANARYGGNVCAPMADWREVLARPDIDGVIISTPDHWHVPLAVHAARAKKDMYVEKPLGVALAWAWKLRQAVAANNVIFQYGTQQRSSKEFIRAVELVRNGYIGKIKSIDAWCADMRSSGGYAESFAAYFHDTTPAPIPPGLDYEMWIGPAPMKPYTKTRCMEWGSYHIYDYALGFIAGWGAHPLDIAQWGLDRDHTGPVEFRGTGEIPAGGLFDTVAHWDIQARYADGLPLHFMSDDVAKPVVEKMGAPIRPFMDHGTTFWGEDGWISVSRGALYASPKTLQTARIRDDEKPVIHGTSQGRNFVESIRSRKPTVNPLESAIRSDTISHLSDIAIRVGRPLRWNPETETISGDAEASKRLDRPMRSPWTM